MKIAVIDLEATCFDKQKETLWPREQAEIIQIGAIMYDLLKADIVDEFDAFIKPVLHPQLTTFCTELTGITQENVDSAAEFPEVYTAFEKWIIQHKTNTFASYGNYDRNHLFSTCDLYNIHTRALATHINIKQVFARCRGGKRVGLHLALGSIGQTFEGTAHNALDDAKNAARVLSYLQTEFSVQQIMAFAR